MPHPFDGIQEKLKRADESIENLHVEIEAFFIGCKYPTLPKLNDERLLDATRYHRELEIPLRFSVLAGEIVHHLRSSFDHIIWHFSSDAHRNSKEGRYIEFPVLDKRPNEFNQYGRKIKGIQNPKVLELIEDLQPYNRPDPKNSLLWITHDIDKIDKHRELVLTYNTGFATFPGRPDLALEFARYTRTEGSVFSPEFRVEFDKYAEISPKIAFKEFCVGQTVELIDGITRLVTHAGNVMNDFAPFA